MRDAGHLCTGVQQIERGFIMKMYLISDNVDTYTGMRLAGVDGVVVHERDELRDALEKVLADKTVGIVLLTEKFPGHHRHLPAGTEDAAAGRDP